MASDRVTESAEVGDEAERHASNLELFLDLVFVFAVTQIAGLFSTDTSPAGFGRGLLLAWLVWWLWSQFTWLGTAIDLSGRSLNQFLILATIPLALLMTVAIPEAYGDSGLRFASAYLAVHLWALAIQGRGLWSVEATRRSWLQYAPLAAVAPCLVLIGALFDRGPRTAIWCVVAVLNVASAVLAGKRAERGQAEWAIDPVHFVERHSLFVIISLGEVLVATGIAASTVPLTTGIGLGVIAAVSGGCVLWWIYFSYVPGVIESALRNSHGADRGRVARNVFSFGHFPLITGIVLYAIVAKHVVAHPGDVMHTSDLVALGLSIATFLGGFLSIQWQVARRLNRERTGTIVVVGALCVAMGPRVSGAVLLAVVVIVIAASHTLSLRRFTRNNPASSPAG